MKNILLAAVTLVSVNALNAQQDDSPKTQYLSQTENSDKGIRLKANALFLPLGIINVAGEFQVDKKITIQGDVLVSPWKSFSGHELQYYSASVEGRYYFKQAFDGFYLGANIAASSYTLQKWNYWKDEPYYNEKNETFTKSDLYQKGHSYLLGITAGYQFRLSDKWFMDIYGTVGSSQDFYKGYERGTGKRYDDAVGYNKSSEILPYRGGIMIAYKIR
ncbi:hypothetical protein ASG31_09465 [Chryseobacterium sp. Leaf404]|uniref:DUF3575 domain-containing protein n=1 Tax=unclassified Chryseobacterium TaxID=2593645 RepID=UPI0006FD6455|nr:MULTISPECIES: DUF3575 domain-containing protein [unclassified Chryseobacterium]KQT17617.1 hypothetical protein ASG31_09465 [Chryseobacterium sp. Leaf404]